MRTLLMGGQACVFYGAAEFSRDLDLLFLIDPANLERLRRALADLEAENIAVPPFDSRHLARGHAVHFRCRRQDVAGLRIDVMSVLRNCAPFEEMWERRSTIEIEGEWLELMSLEDLVHAKKTQRDKDWPMIARLIEQSWFSEKRKSAGPELVRFWLRELRTKELLIEAAAAWPKIALEAARDRRAVAEALAGDAARVAIALEIEEREERHRDREYWQPLKKELEQMRHPRQ